MDEQFSVVDRPMWEVKGKVYYQDTGDLASEADVAAFWERHNRQWEQIQLASAKEAKVVADWEAKHVPLMREFWGQDNDSEDCYNYESMGPDDLVHQLSTTLFDRASPSGDSVPAGQSYMEYCRREYKALTERIQGIPEADLTIEGLGLGPEWSNFKECVERIQKLFPEYWKAALSGFGHGQHDT